MGASGQAGHGFTLVRRDEDRRAVEELVAAHGGRVGLRGLLADLGREARPSRLGRWLGRAVDTAYRWEDADERDARWWPQGITTSADAHDTETVAGRRLVVTSWYAKDLGSGSHGCRLTVLDLETLRYEHVLLVRPATAADGSTTLEPVRIHAGGIVWRGSYVHLAATAQGLVSCRIDDIVRGSAYGHRYLLPVRFSFRAGSTEGQERLRYSFISLDRSTWPPGLLAGEYGTGGATTRLARFGLTGSGVPVTDADGVARPVAVVEARLGHMQGAVIVGEHHHVTVSRGRRWPGSLHVGRPGHFRERRLAVPMGPEDVSHWPSTNRLWTVTEHPRRRWVVSVPLARPDGR